MSKRRIFIGPGKQARDSISDLIGTTGIILCSGTAFESPTTEAKWLAPLRQFQQQNRNYDVQIIATV